MLERDPAAAAAERPTRPGTAGSGAGVNQFRLPHFMLPRWWSRARGAAGGPDALRSRPARCDLNPVAVLPAARRGPMRDGDERFDTVTARRPVLEAALSRGGRGRRGDDPAGRHGHRPAHGRARARASGDRRAHRGRLGDHGGPGRGLRRPALGPRLVAAGGRCAAPGRGARGLRLRLLRPAFPLAQRRQPAALDDLLQQLRLAVGHHAARRQRHLERGPDHQQPRQGAARCCASRPVDAALARYPLVAHWADGEPISGVDVMAGIEDRYRAWSSTASRSRPAWSRSVTRGPAPTRRSAGAPRSR